MKYFHLAALLLWSAINAMAGAELTAPAPQQYAMYGYDVSANGNTLAVINYDYPVAGAVYVYQPITKNWDTAALVAHLSASDGAQFTSVAVYGNVIIAGSFFEQNSQGAVYGFIEPQGGWQNANESFVLTASDGAVGDIFGSSLAFSNKTIVVGAPGHEIGGTRVGAAYVFTEPASGWASGTETAELTDSGRGPSVGYSVAVNGPVVVVGVLGLNAGALDVYQENVGGWQNSTETAQLTDPGPPYCSQLGQSVAIIGNTVVGGFTGGCGGSPRVVVYNRPGNAWTSMSTPTADLMAQQNTKASSRFGWSLALTNKFLAVGDPLLGSLSNRHGAVFVYAAPQGGWQDVVSTTEAEEINSGTHDSQFGNSVSAFSTGTIFVGAPESVVDGVQGAGAVFIKSY
jgi:FG-GAP repeat